MKQKEPAKGYKSIIGETGESYLPSTSYKEWHRAFLYKQKAVAANANPLRALYTIDSLLRKSVAGNLQISKVGLKLMTKMAFGSPRVLGNVLSRMEPAIPQIGIYDPKVAEYGIFMPTKFKLTVQKATPISTKPVDICKYMIDTKYSIVLTVMAGLVASAIQERTKLRYGLEPIIVAALQNPVPVKLPTEFAAKLWAVNTLPLHGIAPEDSIVMQWLKFFTDYKKKNKFDYTTSGDVWSISGYSHSFSYEEEAWNSFVATQFKPYTYASSPNIPSGVIYPNLPTSYVKGLNHLTYDSAKLSIAYGAPVCDNGEPYINMFEPVMAEVAYKSGLKIDAAGPRVSQCPEVNFTRAGKEAYAELYGANRFMLLKSVAGTNVLGAPKARSLSGDDLANEMFTEILASIKHLLENNHAYNLQALFYSDESIPLFNHAELNEWFSLNVGWNIGDRPYFGHLSTLPASIGVDHHKLDFNYIPSSRSYKSEKIGDYLKYKVKSHEYIDKTKTSVCNPNNTKALYGHDEIEFLLKHLAAWMRATDRGSLIDILLSQSKIKDWDERLAACTEQAEQTTPPVKEYEDSILNTYHKLKDLYKGNDVLKPFFFITGMVGNHARSQHEMTTTVPFGHSVLSQFNTLVNGGNETFLERALEADFYDPDNVYKCAKASALQVPTSSDFKMVGYTNAANVGPEKNDVISLFGRNTFNGTAASPSLSVAENWENGSLGNTGKKINIAPFAIGVNSLYVPELNVGFTPNLSPALSMFLNSGRLFQNPYNWGATYIADKNNLGTFRMFVSTADAFKMAHPCMRDWINDPAAASSLGLNATFKNIVMDHMSLGLFSAQCTSPDSDLLQGRLTGTEGVPDSATRFINFPSKTLFLYTPFSSDGKKTNIAIRYGSKAALEKHYSIYLKNLFAGNNSTSVVPSFKALTIDKIIGVLGINGFNGVVHKGEITKTNEVSPITVDMLLRTYQICLPMRVGKDTKQSILNVALDLLEVVGSTPLQYVRPVGLIHRDLKSSGTIMEDYNEGLYPVGLILPTSNILSKTLVWTHFGVPGKEIASFSYENYVALTNNGVVVSRSELDKSCFIRERKAYAKSLALILEGFDSQREPMLSTPITMEGADWNKALGIALRKYVPFDLAEFVQRARVTGNNNAVYKSHTTAGAFEFLPCVLMYDNMDQSWALNATKVPVLLGSFCLPETPFNLGFTELASDFKLTTGNPVEPTHSIEATADLGFNGTMRECTNIPFSSWEFTADMCRPKFVPREYKIKNGPNRNNMHPDEAYESFTMNNVVLWSYLESEMVTMGIKALSSVTYPKGMWLGHLAAMDSLISHSNLAHGLRQVDVHPYTMAAQTFYTLFNAEAFLRDEMDQLSRYILMSRYSPEDISSTTNLVADCDIEGLIKIYTNLRDISPNVDHIHVYDLASDIISVYYDNGNVGGNDYRSNWAMFGCIEVNKLGNFLTNSLINKEELPESMLSERDKAQGRPTTLEENEDSNPDNGGDGGEEQQGEGAPSQGTNEDAIIKGQGSGNSDSPSMEILKETDAVLEDTEDMSPHGQTKSPDIIKTKERGNIRKDRTAPKHFDKSFKQLAKLMSADTKELYVPKANNLFVLPVPGMIDSELVVTTAPEFFPDTLVETGVTELAIIDHFILPSNKNRTVLKREDKNVAFICMDISGSMSGTNVMVNGQATHVFNMFANIIEAVFAKQVRNDDTILVPMLYTGTGILFKFDESNKCSLDYHKVWEKCKTSEEFYKNFVVSDMNRFGSMIEMYRNAPITGGTDFQHVFTHYVKPIMKRYIDMTDSENPQCWIFSDGSDNVDLKYEDLSVDNSTGTTKMKFVSVMVSGNYGGRDTTCLRFMRKNKKLISDNTNRRMMYLKPEGVNEDFAVYTDSDKETSSPGHVCNACFLDISELYFELR